MSMNLAAPRICEVDALNEFALMDYERHAGVEVDMGW